MIDFSWFVSISFGGFLPAPLGSARYDFGWLGWISFDYTFLSAWLAVILIDLVLAGDNAVVIALAVRNLHGKQRTWGIILGAGAAVVLRVICTFFAAQMLRIMFLKFIGGALIAWIAVKLLTQRDEDKTVSEASNLRQAIKLIVIADIVMSLDNMLAVAGASKGNAFLLIFGLGLSIPFVVGCSSLLAKLMDRYPIIVVIGSAVLGKVAGEMMITDPWIRKTFQIPNWAVYAVEVVFVVGVVVVGKLIMKRKKARMKAAEAASMRVLESEPEKRPCQ